MAGSSLISDSQHRKSAMCNYVCLPPTQFYPGRTEEVLCVSSQLQLIADVHDGILGFSPNILSGLIEHSPRKAAELNQFISIATRIQSPCLRTPPAYYSNFPPVSSATPTF
mmetsp:Transcript_46175/g.72254  ORF Transcript_46175/g.72254 Transcript_46175/m.72254 type:complete len:111 (-) Transcript_46175:53-385(-)